jgi:hypothetical protein
MIPQGRLIPSSPKQGAPLQTMPGAPNIHTMQGMGNIQAPPGFTGAMQGNNFIRR